MRIYLWRAVNGETKANWVEQNIVPDRPLKSELKEYDNSEGYHAFPEYAEKIPENTLVNVKYDWIKDKLTLNWSFSYGIVTKNAEAHQIPDEFEIHHPDKFYPDFGKEHKTIPYAHYHYIQDKGGIRFFAIVEDSELTPQEREQRYKEEINKAVVEHWSGIAKTMSIKDSPRA